MRQTAPGTPIGTMIRNLMLDTPAYKFDLWHMAFTLPPHHNLQLKHTIIFRDYLSKNSINGTCELYSWP